MKSIGTRIVALIVIAVSSMALAFASHYEEYHVFVPQPYIGIEQGKFGPVSEERAPHVGLSVGALLSPRLSVEIYAQGEALSSFPGADFDIALADIDSAFALMTGVQANVRMFSDATFNPFIQVGLGNVAIGHFVEDENGENHGVSDLYNCFSAHAATGLEISMFDAFSFQFKKGYRYIPNREMLGIGSHELSGTFSSLAFTFCLD
ncbi:MAG: hypothetical protein PHR90_06905 [Sphaerochaetaceae bacterium]|nr:hypothetical protein [Sphaerochaetaceae bacterium]